MSGNLAVSQMQSVAQTDLQDADIFPLVHNGVNSQITVEELDDRWLQSGGSGNGSVSSVAMSAPSVFNVGGSPITNSGTLALSFAGGQTQNLFLATPNGASGPLGLRAIVSADFPSPIATSHVIPLNVSNSTTIATNSTNHATVVTDSAGNVYLESYISGTGTSRIGFDASGYFQIYDVPNAVYGLKFDLSAGLEIADTSGNAVTTIDRNGNITISGVLNGSVVGAASLNILSSAAGANNGVATLDSGGHVPTAQLPSAIVNGLEFQGTWNANTNSPTLASSTGTKGNVYVVSTAGTTTLDGISSWNAADWAVFDGSVWRKIDGQAAQVLSVAGRTGNVVLSFSDISGIAGVAAGGTGLANISTGSVLSGNGTNALVAISPGTSGLPLVSQGANNAPHYAALAEGGLSLSDVTTGNVSTSAHGFAPKAPNSTTQWLRGDGTWNTPIAFVQAGASHAVGYVPDPGASSHSPPYFLADDGAFRQITNGTNISCVYSSNILTISTSGLAASATTDTTNASNISSGSLAVLRGGAGGITTDSDASTITFDLSVNSVHAATIAADRTLALANNYVGQRFLIRITQGSGGSHTVTWWSGITWAGGSAPTLSTTAGHADLFGFLCTAGGAFDGFVCGQDIH